jgi:hypothetical protein
LQQKARREEKQEDFCANIEEEKIKREKVKKKK